MKGITPGGLWTVLKEAALSWINSEVFRLSASLSYFTVFSIAPLLIIILFIVGLFWGEQSGNVQAQILSEISEMAGRDSAEMVRVMLENAERPGSGGVLATVFGVLALVFGATAVFAQLKGALNTIWEIEPAGVGVKSYLLSRLLAFALVVGVGFLLLVSLVISALIAAADDFIVGLAPELHLLVSLLNAVVGFGVITVLFAMIYRYLPDTQIAWRDVWVGAVITALLFNLGKFGISMYLGNSSVTSTYGAAGSFAVLLLWVYYSALIVFFGAELTQAYVQHYGKRPPRSRHSPARPASADTASASL